MGIKILITGSNGFLGNNLVRIFKHQGYEISGIDLQDNPADRDVCYFKCDITDEKRLAVIAGQVRPSHIVNAVALVDLDVCETNGELAEKINVTTAANVSRAARNSGARLIHISTDHLFRGDGQFYSEDADPDPVNAYGRTKLQAEQAAMRENPDTAVIRTNFYGWSHPGHKPTSAEWMYEKINNNEQITLYTDYYFTPIEVNYLGEALEKVLRSEYRGVLNIVGRDRCSKYEFGVALADTFGLDASCIMPKVMGRGSFKVRRQPDLSLSIKRFETLFPLRLPGLREGLKRFKETRPIGGK